jgi:hypothetical protein
MVRAGAQTSVMYCISSIAPMLVEGELYRDFTGAVQRLFKTFTRAMWDEANRKQRTFRMHERDLSSQVREVSVPDLRARKTL